MRRILVLMLAGVAMLSAADDPGTKEARQAAARRVENRFVAPCCWRESLAVHDSPIAVELRANVEAMLAAGATEPEIVDRMVERYGERILQEPRGARSVVLTALPWVALILAGLGLAAYVRRNVAQAGELGKPMLSPADGAGLDDLDDEW